MYQISFFFYFNAFCTGILIVKSNNFENHFVTITIHSCPYARHNVSNAYPFQILQFFLRIPKSFSSGSSYGRDFLLTLFGSCETFCYCWLMWALHKFFPFLFVSRRIVSHVFGLLSLSLIVCFLLHCKTHTHTHTQICHFLLVCRFGIWFNLIVVPYYAILLHAWLSKCCLTFTALLFFLCYYQRYTRLPVLQHFLIPCFSLPKQTPLLLE